MLIVLFVVSIILAIYVIWCIAMSVYCVNYGYPAFGGIYVCFTILGVIMLYKIANYESQYEWVLQNKPTCTEESVECLSAQLDWVHDSITTASKLTPERLKIINAVNSNDSTHIRLLKNDLNYLRNQNKKEN